MKTAIAPAPKPAPVLSELEHDFLQRVVALTAPASVLEMNDGIPVKWNLECAKALVPLGLIVVFNWDSFHQAPRYVATEAGRLALALPPKPLPPPEPIPEREQTGYGRARRWRY